MKIIYKSFLSGCYLFEHPNFNDERGNFLKIFSNYFKKKMLKNHEIKQVNISTNKKFKEYIDIIFNASNNPLANKESYEYFLNNR